MSTIAMSALAHARAEEGRADDIFAQVARIQSERDAARAQVTALQEANNRSLDENRAARRAVDHLRERLAALALALDAPDFQPRTNTFMQTCFGAAISADRLERGDRAAEEFFEMLQAAGYPRERLLSLIAYVWSRPVGEMHQEVGGVMVTLAAFCQAHGLDMHEEGEVELARVWAKIEKIRAKQAAKRTGSALPQAWPVAQGETYVPAGQLDRDIGILLAQIDWLAECSGEGPEGEDAALVAQIRRDHEARVGSTQVSSVTARAEVMEPPEGLDDIACAAWYAGTNADLEKLDIEEKYTAIAKAVLDAHAKQTAVGADEPAKAEVVEGPFQPPQLWYDDARMCLSFGTEKSEPGQVRYVRAGTPSAVLAAGGVVSWAVERWKAEVGLRPLQNIHRRPLDDTWRQVIRQFGGDPDALLGADHDSMVALAPPPKAPLDLGQSVAEVMRERIADYCADQLKETSFGSALATLIRALPLPDEEA